MSTLVSRFISMRWVLCALLSFEICRIFSTAPNAFEPEGFIPEEFIPVGTNIETTLARTLVCIGRAISPSPICLPAWGGVLGNVRWDVRQSHVTSSFFPLENAPGRLRSGLPLWMTDRPLFFFWYHKRKQPVVL